MNISIALFCRDENDYLQEWINHYRKLGFENIYIGDNNSKIPIKNTIVELYPDDKNIHVYPWQQEGYGKQMRFYEWICKLIKDDMVLVVDTDEFLVLKEHNTIQKFVEDMKKKYGDFSCFSFSWRFYGFPEGEIPETRIPIEQYTKYHENPHQKSLVIPYKVKEFRDPHLPEVFGRRIDEKGRDVLSPVWQYSDKYAYIKHIWTRSKEEYARKLERGRGDGCEKTYNWDTFRDYNKQCIISDERR